jgi:hypothetical protein
MSRVRQIEIQLENPVKEYEVCLHGELEKEITISDIVNVGDVLIYDLVKLSEIYGDELYPQIFYLQTSAGVLLYAVVDLNDSRLVFDLSSSEITTLNTTSLDLSASELNMVLEQIIEDPHINSVVDAQDSVFHLSSNVSFVFASIISPDISLLNLGTNVTEDTSLTVYMLFLDCGVVRYNQYLLSEMDNELLSSLDSRYESMSLKNNVLSTYHTNYIATHDNDIVLDSDIDSVDITTLIKDDSTFNLSLEDIIPFVYEAIFKLKQQISHLTISAGLTTAPVIDMEEHISHLQTGLEYRTNLYEVDYQTIRALDGSLLCNIDGDLGVLRLTVYAEVGNDISIDTECTITLYNGFSYYDDMLLSELDDQYLYVLEAEK